MLTQRVKNHGIAYSVLGYSNIKSILKNSSIVDQLLSKKLKASPCCWRALYSLCQEVSHRKKWEHTYSALPTVNGRLLVICGLLKAFSGICVKANSFCCYGLWSRDSVFGMQRSLSILAYQDSALLMWSYSQRCFIKCAEGVGCYNNMLNCIIHSKNQKPLILNKQALVPSITGCKITTFIFWCWDINVV